jgi:TatD DNase family protein
MLIDTHCHLDFPEFDRDRDAVIKRAREEGVSHIINIASSLKGCQKSLELAGQYDFIYASVGIHPHEADKFDKESESIIRELARKDKVVAIGEIGLDYYRNFSQAKNQRTLFVTLLKLAKDLVLPLIIHTRQAQIDTLKILKDFLPIQAVVHCFSADEDFLKECLDLGFFISFTCNISYPKAQNLRNLVKVTPMERLFLETDAPFLAPQELRGRRNEPAYVKFLAGEIAKIKEISQEEVADVTTENAKTFFGIR